MRRLVAWGCAAAVLGGALGGCGNYTFNPNLPTHIKTLALPLVKNPRTYKYGAERTLTDSLVNEFVHDGTLDVTDEDAADAKLAAEIVSYKKEAQAYDVHETVSKYNLAMVLSITFFDLTTGQVLWQEPSFYDAVTYYATGPNAETEDEALQRLCDDIAQKVVNRTMQGW